MSTKTHAPFRADHVGSLLRSKALHDARAQFAVGRLDRDELTAAEDASIREVVARQEALGLRAVTDGEQRRGYWHLDFIQSLPGLRPSGESYGIPFTAPDGSTILWEEPAHEVTEEIRLDRTIFGEHLAFLQDVVTTATAKLSIPSPNHVNSPLSPLIVRDGLYADHAALQADIASVYRDQIARLHAQGLRYLQIDDVSLALFGDENVQARLAAAGADPATTHLAFIAQLNSALADRPAGLHVATHLCRGNFRSAWAAQGGYDVVAEALFNDLNVDAYFLEFDTERAGSFAPLRHLPKGKHVNLGLVTTKSPALEAKDDLLRRIEDAARYVDIDQLGIAPQCGFSSTEHGNSLTAEEQWAKLALVVEVAEEVWG